MADNTPGVLFIETERLKKFCEAMRSELEGVFKDVDTINRELDEFVPTWEGNLRDNFCLLYEDTKKDAVNAKAQWEKTMEKFEQAAAAYARLEEQIESLGASQG